jgi:anti-sigma regulatory factor (Ser/Thr protein kinase)
MPVPTDASESGATLSLAPAGSAPSEARRFVAGRLRQWQLAACEDVALLLVSELVTNALLHARTDIVVALSRVNGSVVVEVTDGSTAAPARRQFSVHAGTGRGLNLVAALSTDWGVRRVAGGKTVWASVATEPGNAAISFDVDSVDAL